MKIRSTLTKGLSLIELLLVVAIILITVAIAIPNLLRARIAANEASAVGPLHALNAAAYNASWGNGYPPSLTALGTTISGPASCQNAELVDAQVTSGTKSGYTLALVPGTVKATKASSSCKGGYGYLDGYIVTATPLTVGITGQRAFCSDASGIIGFNIKGKASYTKPLCAATMTPVQ
jgi:type IV pilus assembly protein PilA